MNSEYWEKRIANETWKTYNDVEEKNRDLIEMYNASLESIKKELYYLAEKSEKDGSLGRTDQYRFDKLLGQKGHIYKEIERLGEEFEKTSKERIFNAGKEVSSNVFESLGINDYSMPNIKAMEQMLRSPWKGSFFSKRLWKDLGKLESNLEGLIKDGISTGKTTTEMAIQFANEMNEAFNVAHRLVRSETINYMNRSALESYKNAGISKVQWWAAEDERTCEQCGGNHGKPHDVKDAPVLPCHPNCRCTWIPVVDEQMSLTKKEEAALVKYIGPDSYVLNEKLRNGSKLDDTDRDWIKNINLALEKLPSYDGDVIRVLDFYNKSEIHDFIKLHEEGNSICYNQFISSSKEKGYNEDGQVMLFIKSKTGKDISILNPEESEVLFRIDTSYFVSKIAELDGKTIISIEEE